MSLRVLLVDDHTIFREGLRFLAERLEDLQVVGQADDGRTAVALARTLRPDVVVMDVALPDMNGAEATRQICTEDRSVRVVALSMHADTQFVARMLEAGACAYLLKECAFEELEAAIRAVMDGRVYLSSQIAGTLVENHLRRLTLDGPTDFSPLSPRERQVVQLMAEGITTKQIAARLKVSPKTVETHRSRIMRKLNIHSVAELTKYAIRAGLTPLEG